MPKVGLKYPVYKGASSGVIGKAIQADIAIETNNAELYSDDAVSESDKSFKRGKITLGVDDLSDIVQREFLGHTIEATGEVTGNENDQCPYVGIGFYGAKVLNRVRKYRAVWFPKVQFSEPNDNNKTKGENVEFSTPTIEGTIMKDSNGDWKKEQTFATEADAISYLNAKSGNPVSSSAGLSALLLTGTGGTLSPAFGSAVRYYTFGGLTAVSVTVAATAANHTIQLYIDGVLSQTLVSGTASAAINVAIGTKKLTIVAQETGKSSQTTEIIVVKTV